MDIDKRAKLETDIEKEVYRLITTIKEHMNDFVHIYANRNHLDVDRDLLKGILKIADSAIVDGLGSKMDNFKTGIKKTLDEYTEQEAKYSTLSPKVS